MKTAIIIPVFNEAKNIENIVKKINDVSKSYHMIFIDDYSKDGSLEILKKVSKKYNMSFFVRKNKKGYGSALRFGFKKAKNFDFVVTMDGDLSHNPEEIPKMLKVLKKENAEMVIGSRYVKGGKIKNWPLIRKFTSWMANESVSISLDTGIKDNTSGFRAYSNGFLKKIVPKLKQNGYAVLEEILFLAQKEKTKIVEVPITFKDRVKGKSKANFLKEGLDLLSLILRLRNKGIQMFLMFLFVGLTGIFVNEGLLYFLTEKLGVFYLVSGAIAIEVSIIYSFILNDAFTFRKKGKGSYFKRMINFNIARLLTAVINFTLLFVLTFFGLNYLISNLIGIAIGTLFGFWLSIKWVWK